MSIELKPGGTYRLANGEHVEYDRQLPNGLIVTRKLGEVPGYHHRRDGRHAHGDRELDVVRDVTETRTRIERAGMRADIAAISPGLLSVMQLKGMV